MELEIVETMGNAEYWWLIHKSGCQDVAKEARKYRHCGGGVLKEEAASGEAWVKNEIENLNADHGQGAFQPGHFKIMPCCKGAK